MKRYDRRPRWRAAMLRSSSLTPTTKLVMTVLLEHMDHRGMVRYPVKDIARELGIRNFRRVSDRISEAHRAGYLITVTKAVHGRVAEYQATIPSDLQTGSLEAWSEVPANRVTGNRVTRREDAGNRVTSITSGPHVARPQRAATKRAHGCDECEDYGCAACIPDAGEAS